MINQVSTPALNSFLFLPLRKAIKTKKKTFKLQGRYRFQELPIAVENKAGSIRRSMPGEKPVWMTKMGYDYGYIVNTMATDGEGVDAYVSRKSNGMRDNYHQKEGEPDRISTDVYVVHQLKIWHSANWNNGICPDCHKHHSECTCPQHYDEDKVMLGFDSKDDAINGYLQQYDSKRFLGPVSTYTIDEFKAALKRSWGKKLPSKKEEHEHWHGFDLDGTMAKDDGWKGREYIGPPIKKIIEKIQKLQDAGKKVKVLTARAFDKKAIKPIQDWMKNNNIPLLEITNEKDPGMIDLHDDRAVQVRKNTGNLVKSISETYYLDWDKMEKSMRAPKGVIVKVPEQDTSGINMNVLESAFGVKFKMEKSSYLGQPGDPSGSHAILKENIHPKMVYHTIGGALDEIDRTYIKKCFPGETLQMYTARFMRENSGNQVAEMLSRPQNSDLVKAFVRVKAHTRKGKRIEAHTYFDKRTKKVANVKHQKLLGLDLSKKEADTKIAALHKKKEHHDLHIEAAEEMKAKVEAHKQSGNTQYKVGEKEHHVDKVLKDLDNHIDHHSNEKKSHDNHIRKIEKRHETVAKQWERKKEAKKADKQKAIDEMIKDGEHEGKKLSDDVLAVLKKMKGEDKPESKKVVVKKKTPPDFKEMVGEAAKWKGAAMKVAETLEGDKKAQLRHSKQTTKGDLDNYLIGKFGVDAVTARSVSNELTDKNIPNDKSASAEDFKGEAWAKSSPDKKVVVKKEAKPADRETIQTYPGGDFTKLVTRQFGGGTNQFLPDAIKRYNSEMKAQGSSQVAESFLDGKKGVSVKITEVKGGPGTTEGYHSATEPAKTEAEKKETRSQAMAGNQNAKKFGSHEEYSNWLRKQSDYVKENHKLDNLVATWPKSEGEGVDVKKVEPKKVVVAKKEEQAIPKGLERIKITDAARESAKKLKEKAEPVKPEVKKIVVKKPDQFTVPSKYTDSSNVNISEVARSKDSIREGLSLLKGRDKMPPGKAEAIERSIKNSMAKIDGFVAQVESKKPVKKVVVPRKEEKPKTEAEEAKNRSDAMKGNKNAYKGGPKEEPKKVVVKKEDEIKTPFKKLSVEEISKLPIDKQKKYFGEIGEEEYKEIRKMGEVVSGTIDKMVAEGEEKLKERSRKLDEISRDLSARKVRRNSNEYKKYSEASSKLYNDKNKFNADKSNLKREGILSIFPALKDVRGAASGFVDKYGSQHGKFIRDLQDAKIEIGLQNRRDYLMGDQKTWLVDKAIATDPAEYAKKLGVSEDVAKELPRAFGQHLLSKYSGSTFYSKPNTNFDELLTDYWQKNKAKHSGKGIEIQEDVFKPKVTGNHHDYSEDDHSFLLPDITTKGFTKFTKLELKGEGHETVQRAAKEFEELKKSLIKSENLERDPSDKFRDRKFKIDGGYQIVDGRIFLRAAVSQDKYIYAKEREEPTKRPQKRKSFVYSPDVQLGKEGMVELKGGWKAELKMQRILYNQINHKSEQSSSLLSDVRRIGGTYGAHDFFQKAQYNEDTGLIESKVEGSGGQEISASFQPERFKMMLSFFNAGGESRFGSSGYVVPEANLTRSVRDALDIFKADQDASRERISSTYYEAYLEGRETSFGTRNAVDDILDSHGVLIKRQNGEKLSEDDKQKLEKVVDETYKAIGNKDLLSKMAKENKLKVSFSGEKMAFLTKYVGLYVPVESTIVIGKQMEHVLPHEFAHFMDDNLGDQAKSGRGSYASEMQHTSVGKLTVLGRKTFSRDSKRTQKMDGYWNRSTEVFARMVEQYAAVNHYKDESYYGRDGYWTEKNFEKIKPEIEKVLTEKFGKSFMNLFLFN